MQEDCCSLAFPTNSVPVPTLEMQTMIVDAAHRRHFVVIGHAISHDMTEVILKSGADGLAHTFIDLPPSDEIVTSYKQAEAFVIPTLSAMATTTGEEQTYRDRFAKVAASRGLVNETFKEILTRSLSLSAPNTTIDNAYCTIKRLFREGIDVVAGTDATAGVAGLSVGPSFWMEMQLYVDKCGMSVTEVLRSATSVSARRMGLHDRGTVKPGKRADLLLVRGDVTQNLNHLWTGEGIARVWKQGNLVAW